MLGLSFPIKDHQRGEADESERDPVTVFGPFAVRYIFDLCLLPYECLTFEALAAPQNSFSCPKDTSCAVTLPSAS